MPANSLGRTVRSPRVVRPVDRELLPGASCGGSGRIDDVEPVVSCTYRAAVNRPLNRRAYGATPDAAPALSAAQTRARP